MALSADEVRWMYRILLQREPESEAVVEAQRYAYNSAADMRRAFADTPDFKASVRQPKYQGISPFLLPEPVDGVVTIRVPTLEAPVSQMATFAQMGEVYFTDFCRMAELDQAIRHRKHWEWAYIHRVLQVAGMCEPGKSGLVFAVGEEPLPSVLASYGVKVMATDGPPEVAAYWSAGAQYADELQTLWHKNIVSWETLKQHVTHGLADMNNIPATLRGYDFVWSSCSLEHLGGLRKGMDFVINSMDTLKPGGLAVHTTEFNLSSNDDTVDASPTCLYRKRDFEQLAAELTAAGHDVWPLNFYPGGGIPDMYIDYPPYGLDRSPEAGHVKIALLNYVTTSAGIVVRKKA